MTKKKTNDRQAEQRIALSETAGPGWQKPLSRRQWLNNAAALAGSAMMPVKDLWAQTSSARPFRVDTHHHHSQGGGWTPMRSIEAMDRSGIATAILSRPAIPVSDPEKARKLARDTNEYAAQVVRDNPTRFGLFATLPLFDVDGSLREIAYGYDTLKTDGVCFSTSYAGRWPGDPMFAPVFDELNRRKAVVFIHPAAPAYYNNDFTLKIQPAALEFMFDSARAAVSLILNGTLMRCPDVKIILGHGGGTLPFLHERLDHLVGEEPPSDGEWTTGDNRFRSPYVPNGFENEMRKFYFDVVRVANPANFALLMQVMPPGRLLLGTDYPVVPTGETVGHLPGLHLDDKVLRGIERDNAVSLFPRLRA